MFNIANAAIETSVNPIFGPNMEPGDFILTVISIFVLIAGILCILFILWGALLLILSGGKDDKIKPAINTIRYAIIGVIITVVAIFVFPILGKLLGIDVNQYAQPSKIFEKIDQIGNNIFGATDETYGTNTQGQMNDLPANFSDL